MILEFTGLSGAGKTTSEPCIILGLKQRGIQVISREELKDRCKQGIIFPNYADHLGVRILSNRLYRLSRWKSLISSGLGGGIFREVLTKRRRLIFSLLGEDINLTTYFLHEFKPSGAGPSVYIPHEGFVHHSACFKLWGGVGFPDLAEKLLQKIPSEKFTILYFKISVEDALDRLLKRGVPESWQLHINSKSRIKEILLRFNEAIEGNVEKFQANGVKVLTIDASLEPQQVEARIKTILENFPKIGSERELEIQPNDN